MQRPTESSRVSDFLPSAPSALPGQVVLVLQGGGALGSYQAGVHQALHEAGIEPDWIVGTSIGAINASLIAGNTPQDRLPRPNEFWSRVQREAHDAAVRSPSLLAEPSGRRLDRGSLH